MLTATDASWLAVTRAVAQEADCRRRRVGAAIVRGSGEYLSRGANAVPSGPGCMGGGCPRGLLSLDELPPGGDYKSGPGLCYAVHAEHNAINNAQRAGFDLHGTTLYCTDKPCKDCSDIIRDAGIARVVTPEGAYSVQGKDEDRS